MPACESSLLRPNFPWPGIPPWAPPSLSRTKESSLREPRSSSSDSASDRPRSNWSGARTPLPSPGWCNHFPSLEPPSRTAQPWLAAWEFPLTISARPCPARSSRPGSSFSSSPSALGLRWTRSPLERPTLQRLFEAAGLPERGVLAFHPEPDRELPGSYTRMFAPCLGVAEDPATGSASGPLGAYLFRQGVVTTAQATRLLSLQGVKMGRPSSITISLTTSQETIQGAGWAVRPSSSGRGL
jgi:hypothetical protein